MTQTKSASRPPLKHSPPRLRRPSLRLSFSSPIVYLLLLCYFIAVVYPMLWLFYTSLKPDQEIFLHPFALPTRPEWSNFSRAWIGADFWRCFVNSTLVTAATVAITCLTSAMAAYALARFVFPGARATFFFFLSGLMIPIQLAIVPLFFQLKEMHLLNSLPGLSLVYIAMGMSFAIFVMTGFFKTLSSSLHESALLDGAGEWGAFWHVMLPLSKPGLITVAIFLFLQNWNEFFIAFMTLSGKNSELLRTLPLGLANTTIVSQYRSDWGVAFAGLVIVTLPTLIGYIFLQKHLTKGITAGAVKG